MNSPTSGLSKLALSTSAIDKVVIPYILVIVYLFDEMWKMCCCLRDARFNQTLLNSFFFSFSRRAICGIWCQKVVFRFCVCELILHTYSELWTQRYQFCDAYCKLLSSLPTTYFFMPACPKSFLSSIFCNYSSQKLLKDVFANIIFATFISQISQSRICTKA